MDRRKKILIGVLILLLLLLLGWLIWWRLQPATAPPAVPSTPVVPVLDPSRSTPDELEPSSPLYPDTETAIANVSLESAAMTFTERYGSYSSDADFANLRDVLPLMSDAFAARTEAYIATATAGDSYFGVTTHVLSVDVESMDETTAIVSVSTQREEAVGSAQNVEVKYQTLLLSFVKEAGAWKVDQATWQ